jgi:hypothetical protein
MSLASERAGLDAFLERHLWTAGWWKLFAVCIPLAFVVLLAQDALKFGIDLVLSSLGFPGRMAEVTEFQANMSWVSPLLIAPVLENLFCLFWVIVLGHKLGRTWWLVPAIVASIASAFHVVGYLELRYASIFANFFAMCCLIHNVRNRVAGFWASVFLHFLTNFLVLLQFRFQT